MWWCVSQSGLMNAVFVASAFAWRFALIGCYFGLTSCNQNPESREICMYEEFEANCRRNDVIVIQTAKFGRMTAGRCVPPERAKHMNCFTDVTSIMERECSGRQHCQVKVPHPDFHSPCPADLGSYLQVEYVCRPASSCNPGRPTQLNDVTSGYIVANSNRSCQTRLTALQGQAIKLTFINFHSKQTAAIPSNQCFNYVKIIDDARSVSDAGGSEQVTNKCAAPVLDQQASSSRVYPSFVSKSHDIRLTVQYSATQDIGHLLMYYEAMGCGDPDIPMGATLTRNGDMADVTCSTSSRAWHLVCNVTHWVGEIGTCPGSVVEEYSSQSRSQDPLLRFPHGIVMAILTGVALGVVLGCVGLGCYVTVKYLRSSHNHYEAAQNANYKLCGVMSDEDAQQAYGLWRPPNTPEHLPDPPPPAFMPSHDFRLPSSAVP